MRWCQRVLEPRIHSHEQALHRKRQVRMTTHTRSLELAGVATVSIPGAGAAQVTTGDEAT